MTDSLVFDFPDTSPQFDFDNFGHGGNNNHNSSSLAVTTPSSGNKKSGKKSRTNLFKSRFLAKSSNSHSHANSSSSSSSSNKRPSSPVGMGLTESPLNKSVGDESGTTATTASLSVGSNGFSPPRSSSLKYNSVNNRGHYSPKSSSSPKRSNNNNSNSSNGGRESPRFEFSLFDDTSPKSNNSSGMRKQQPNPYSNLTSTTTTTSTNNNLSTPLHTHLTNNHNIYNGLLSSDRTAASGYFSEVSEFSFDRVTVTTERTGVSSNVSWNFFDGSPSQDGGGGGSSLNNSCGDGVDEILGALGSSQRRNDPSDYRMANKLLDEELLFQHSGDDDGITGVGEIHQRCDQSVISEISEGIDGLHDIAGIRGGGGKDDGMEFINAVLRDKYNDDDDDVGKKKSDDDGRGSSMQFGNHDLHVYKRNGGGGGGGTVSTATPTTASTAATPPCQQNSGNNNTSSTISTLGNSNDHLGFANVASTHATTKSRPKPTTTSSKHTTTTPNRNNRPFLKAIIEDIQFCGMYFCGIDTTVQDDGQLTDDQCKDGRVYPNGSKEARAKELDDSLLGQFVMCTGCGPNV